MNFQTFLSYQAKTLLQEYCQNLPKSATTRRRSQNLSEVILRIHALLGLLKPQKRSEVTAWSSPVVRSLALQAATPSSASSVRTSRQLRLSLPLNFHSCSEFSRENREGNRKRETERQGGRRAMRVISSIRRKCDCH